MEPPSVMSRDEIDEATLAEIAKACNVPASSIEDIYSCTPLQLSMIAETRSEMFHFVVSFGLAADIDRFCEALRQVVSLNSVLRTRLVKCSLGIVQVVTNAEHSTERRSGDVEEYLCDEEARCLGFGEPLFRSMFIDRAFVATIHHAIMDHWSMTTFFNVDVAAVYYGHPLKARPPFKEFVGHCMNIDEAAAKSFWASRFKGIPAIFPKVEPGYTPHAIQRETWKIPLKRIGNGVPHIHVPYYMEAAWALTASIYTGSESVAYGYVLSGRSSSALDGVETTLGPTITEVPIQVTLQRNMTVERLIKERATSLRQLQKHPASQYGLSKIGAVSKAAQTASEFQTLFNIRPVFPTTSTKTDVSHVSYDRMVWLRGSFVLQLVCNILDDGVTVEPRTDPAVLCDRQLHRVLNQFGHTLQLLTEAPPQTKLDNLQTLNSHDRLEIFTWNKTIPERMEKCVHEVFSAQARAQPDAMAVESGDGSATYSTLDQASDRLAHTLQKRGVSPGKPVGFIFGKSLWAIVAILGIMKAGGTCVPIDNSDSYDRKAATISSADVKTVLVASAEYANSVNLVPDVFVVSQGSVSCLPEVSSPLVNGTSSPEDVAYIAFTGGSTGAPKGVMLEHRCLVSSLTSLSHRLDWRLGCRMLQFAGYASGNSLCEILGTLLSGGCLCIPPSEACGFNLSSFIESAEVNWALLTPSVLRTLSPSDVPSLQSLLCIGEPVDAEVSKIWGGALRFFNGWGTCEASMLSTVAEIIPSSQYPESIGVPVGCAIWIVTSQNTNKLAPIGSVGELLIEGPGVARGYLNDESKTGASFITSPQWAPSYEGKSTQFYRTGDLARYNPDGSICFVGRQSNRVKLSGQTVQLEEIESILARCDEVRDVVTLVKISAGRTQLFAIVCLTDPGLPRDVVLQKLPDTYADIAKQRLEAVRTYARFRLPSEKVPTIWLAVEKLPRSVSQKLDRPAILVWLKTLAQLNPN